MIRAEATCPDCTPKPGSNDAVKAGCTCPVLDNARGAGWLGTGEFWFTEGCPVHTRPRRTEPDMSGAWALLREADEALLAGHARHDDPKLYAMADKIRAFMLTAAFTGGDHE